MKFGIMRPAMLLLPAACYITPNPYLKTHDAQDAASGESTGSGGGGSSDSTSTPATGQPSTGGTTESLPVECGNGVLQQGELCDDRVWDDVTCDSLGFAAGAVACTPDCQLDVTACEPRGMTWIPPGGFDMGADALGEQPVHRVTLDAFYIDHREVTVGEYAACVDAGACPAPARGEGFNYDTPERDDHPVNGVAWEGAHAFCAWVDRGTKRLPTEAEWERVASAADDRLYPWGNGPAPSCSHVVMHDPGTGGPGCGAASTRPVGSKPLGISPHGALDMAGNVMEWVADWYGPYGEEPIHGPRGPEEGTMRVLRGGSWVYDWPEFFRTTRRYALAPDQRLPGVGFRCAREAI